MASNVAFEILYKEYYVRVFGLCRRLLNSKPLAEDATQETFMRAFRSFNSYDSNQQFWHWISTIATNHCIDLLRKQNRSPDLFGDEEVEFDQLETGGKPIVNALIEAEDGSSLTSSITQLQDKYRIPLVLAYFHDASYEEIAEQLSISRNHVGVLLLRAKQKLREHLESIEGYTP